MLSDYSCNSWLAESSDRRLGTMAAVYDEVEIEDMEFDAEEQAYYYPCPCGDRFCIDLEELYDGEDIATCPSCSLTIRVIFDEEDLPELKEEKDAE
ncbi:unnamed protein product [Phytophthora lilii]|uniref:Diphthamide biosynthesis protein 3 n=1 Tax=Phytophthora lilii TaxID=2077276 RepID=A0A9W6XAE9_9STRA|nr:unnamed protein product [Phytophthora lilii]